MTAALIVGLVVTCVALIGLLGSVGDNRAWPSQVVVLALPLAIIAPGLATSIGMTFGWALVSTVAVLLAVLAGSVLGRSNSWDDPQGRPAAAGLSLVFSGVIALGLAVVVVMWASRLINTFAYLNSIVLTFVLVLGAVAYGIGGRGITVLSRVVLALIALGALIVFVAGVAVGNLSAVAAPEISVDSVPLVPGLLYAAGVVLIGAGFPVLRLASHNNRKAGVTAAVILALVLAVYLIGMLAIYGGGYQLPSLVINVFAVFTPAVAGAITAGLVTIVSTVVAGACIRAASDVVATVVPAWYSDLADHPGPRRWVGVAIGLAVFIVAAIRPAPAAIVSMLAVLATANLVSEYVLSRKSRTLVLES
jgi:hypothetical protein